MFEIIHDLPRTPIINIVLEGCAHIVNHVIVFINIFMKGIYL